MPTCDSLNSSAPALPTKMPPTFSATFSTLTIETHLTRVFQKLGLRSRVQVAAAVTRPG